MNILVCPLNWGIGHATRCIPIIKQLGDLGHRVIIGANGRSLNLLKKEFPDLICEEFPGFDITYSKSPKWFLIHILFKVPGFIFSTFQEKKLLKTWISKHHIDLVISDNRYGIYSSNCPSVFITHQLNIQVPRIRIFGIRSESIVEKLLKYFVIKSIKKFDQIWIPDYEGELNLSGKLAHSESDLKNLYFIGPLSRFNLKTKTEENTTYEIMGIISGVEPHRTFFENILLKELNKTPGNHVIVSGKPEGEMDVPKLVGDNVMVYSHASSENLLNLLQSSKRIICRPGYSTLMELASLKKNNLEFVPTPGQTEQIYLAKWMQQNQVGNWMEQEGLTINPLEKTENYTGFEKYLDASGLLSNFLKENILLQKNS